MARFDYTGMVIGRLTFLEKDRKNGKTFWKVLCQCGEKQFFSSDYISTMKCRGSSFECSKCKWERKSPTLTSKKFGRLTVLKEVPSNTKDRAWLVRCDCGVEKEVISSRLTSKSHPTRSCGCLARKLNSKWVNTTQYPPAHQLKTKTTEDIKFSLYHISNSFVSACYRIEDDRYKNHGAKGHTVCDLWRNGAKDFVKWALGKGFKKGDGVYLKEDKSEFSPKNCVIQSKASFAKKNNSIFIKYKGKTQSISDWAKELGCSTSCLSNRYKKYKNFGLEYIMDLKWVKERKKIYGTEHFENDIIRLYQEGKSFLEIQKELGCQFSTIKRFLVKNNIPPRPAERRSALKKKEVMTKVHEFVNQGKSLLEISKILNIKYQDLGYHYRNFKRALANHSANI
jgi:transposase